MHDHVDENASELEIDPSLEVPFEQVEAPDPLVGDHVGNCWLVKKLGEGGFGSVYRAIDEANHRPVAVKIVKREKAKAEVVKKFLRGCIAAAQLDHENIVRIYKVGRDDKQGLHYLVMEHLRGHTLQTEFEEKHTYRLKEILPVLIAAGRGLEAAHAKSILHRDVKPDNVMLSIDGSVKLTDLGLARISSPGDKTTRVMGTPHFMAPEQFEGRNLDARSDIFGFGVMTYYLLTGKFPYEGKNSMQIVFSMLSGPPHSLLDRRPGTPPELWAVVERCIQKEKSKRPDTMTEVLEVYEAVLEKVTEDL